MREVYDFSNAKIRCHALFYVTTKGKVPTPKDKYSQLQQTLANEVAKYHELSDRSRDGKTGLSKAAKIAGLEQEIDKLEPKKHEDPLSAGARSYLKRLYGYLKYNKWSATLEKGNKYTDKGRLAEPASIELISGLDGIKYGKNEECFETDLIMGTPDIVTFKNDSPRIIDVKSSWDWDTFSENIGKQLNPLYYWQMQGYLEVTDTEEGEVDYCLVDTPEVILSEEGFKLFRRMDCLTMETPEYLIAAAKMRNNMTFSDMPAIERRLMFPVKRDQSAIERIEYIIPKCRDYLFEIQEMHLTGYFSDKELPILESIEEL